MKLLASTALLLVPLAIAAPASSALNETDLFTRDKQSDFPAQGGGKMDITTYAKPGCKGVGIDAHDVKYNTNNIAYSFQSIYVGRNLLDWEHLDFSFHKDGTAGTPGIGAPPTGKRDLADNDDENMHAVTDVSAVPPSILERTDSHECEKLHQSAPRNLKKGCFDVSAPVSCFRIWKKPGHVW